VTETITGWRGWAIDGDPPILVSPLTGFDPWLPGDLTAVCNAIPIGEVTSPDQFRHVRPEQHGLVPDPGCSCGFRVLELDRLVYWFAKVTAMKGPGEAPFVPDCIGGAEIWGRTCGSDRADPRQAMRGEHARVTGPLFICEANADDAGALAARYGVDVIVAGVGKRAWIQGGFKFDFLRYRDNRAALGARLTTPAALTADDRRRGRRRPMTTEQRQAWREALLETAEAPAHTG
jgi:hypothetical protein